MKSSNENNPSIASNAFLLNLIPPRNNILNMCTQTQYKINIFS
jgi:hypothetical protein